MSHNNSKRHKYLSPRFWLNPENMFWLSDKHTPASREYFATFVEGQRILAERKSK